MNPKVTLKDVAAAVGTSIGTVDRALNDRGRIKEETRLRIRRVADELGYRPNRMARLLQQGCTPHIAVVMPTEPEYFFGEMRDGIQDSLRELEDYGVTADYFFTRSIDPGQQEDVLKQLPADRFDALMINAGSPVLVPYMDAFAEQGLPVVTFNSDVGGSRRLFYVGEDPYKSGALAGELMGKLLRQGGKVAVLTGFRDVIAQSRRCTGFRDALTAEAGETAIVFEEEYFDDIEQVRRLTARLLGEHPDIDGVFLTTAIGAIGVGEYIRGEAPARKPVIIGYDTSPYVADLLREDVLTAVIYQDPYNQGYYAMKLLAAYLLGRELPERRHLLLRAKLVMKANASDYVFTEKTKGRVPG